MNWGYKIVCTFIVFASMICYLAYRSMSLNTDLVDNEYYKSELVYQHTIDGSNSANLLSTAPEIKQTGHTVTLQMPSEMKGKPLTGTVLFFCIYNSAKDKSFPLKVNENGLQVFPDSITAGNYTVKIDWNDDKKNYYSESKANIF